MILKPIKVLVPLPTHLAAVRFLLLHADGARIRHRGNRVDNRVRAVLVCLELLVSMAVLCKPLVRG